MTNVTRSLIVLCLVATVLGLDCFQNYTPTGAFTWHANEAVGQYFAASRITDNQFISAGLYRADTTPVSGTFYIIPGQSANTTLSIWSTAFSSSTDTVYANGTVALSVGNAYTFLWVRDSNGNSTDIYQAGNWQADSTGFFVSSFTDPDNAGQFCFYNLPQNNPPTHTIRGFSDTTPNTFQVNSPQLMFRINQGNNGVNLQIFINDTDLIGDPNGLLNFTAQVTTTASASGSGYAYFYLNSADTTTVNVIENSNSLISLTGTLANLSDTVPRISIKWIQEILSFRITVYVNDMGNYGGCNGVPCALWTTSRTDFRTSLTGT